MLQLFFIYIYVTIIYVIKCENNCVEIYNKSILQASLSCVEKQRWCFASKLNGKENKDKPHIIIYFIV